MPQWRSRDNAHADSLMADGGGRRADGRWRMADGGCADGSFAVGGFRWWPPPPELLPSALGPPPSALRPPPSAIRSYRESAHSICLIIPRRIDRKSTRLN